MLHAALDTCRKTSVLNEGACTLLDLMAETSERTAEVRPTLVALHMCQTRSKTTLAVYIKSRAALSPVSLNNVLASTGPVPAASRQPCGCQAFVDAMASHADS